MFEEPQYGSEEECIIDFFKNNVAQLNLYKNSFDDIHHENCEKCRDNCEIRQIYECQKNIQNEYLPIIFDWINTYDCIEKEYNVRKLIIKLYELQNIKYEFFLQKLKEIIDFIQLII
jgi:hypothetical protein